MSVASLAKGIGKEVKVFSQLLEIQRFFVNDDAVGFERHHVFARGVGIHGDQEIDFFSAGNPSVLIGPDRKPGREASNIGRKEVFATNGNPHLKDRSHEDGVGRLASGPVDGGNLNTEIVYYQFLRIASLVLLQDSLGRLF